MAGVNDNGRGSKTGLKLETPGALSAVGYNSIISGNETASSDDEAPSTQTVPADQAETAIGVSIGREQTRLTSPQTPAVEKAAAIDRAGGFFGVGEHDSGTLVEEDEEHEDQDVTDTKSDAEQVIRLDGQDEHSLQSEIPERSPRKTPVRLPSPWQVQSSVQWQQNNEKADPGLLDGLFGRRRQSSKPDTMPEGWQKSLLSSLPSFPKRFSIASPFASPRDSKDAGNDIGSEKSSKRSSLRLPNSENEPVESDIPKPTRQRSESDGYVPELGRKVTLEAVRKPPIQARPQPARQRTPLLRRSTSDQSLLTQRTLSLGDDTRFENVQDQVNSRLKAIRDSWQDSNIKLPSLPNFSMNTFKPEFIRERSVSSTRKQSIREHPPNVAGHTKSARPVDPMTRQPYASTRAMAADAGAKSKMEHPHFNRALEQLEGDVVILGGYRGSILRSAEPPNRQVWVPVKVGLNLRKVNLQVGIEEGDDERATESIIPGGMLTHIGPVDMSRRLFKRLRSCENCQSGKLRVHDYGYDWRLDPNHLSKQLISFLETLSCNKSGTSKAKRGATVIAHSLGGLITRHAVNKRPELFKGVIYAGTPKTCVNILGPMRNGDEVLLSSRVLTAQVNFTIRTSFALLPLDGRCFFDKRTKEEYPVDFFDPQHWVDYRWSPCVSRPLPSLSAQPKPTGITGYVSSMASALPSLPSLGRRGSIKSKNTTDQLKPTTAAGAVGPDTAASNSEDSNTAVDRGKADDDDNDSSTSIGTAVTIPRDQALAYLKRTLASVKKFKQELAFNAQHAASNAYPPVAVIYGKSTPTVYGAKVDGREGIKHADAYDELAFASGDGVVLARAAMVPTGYATARGGVVSSERGHVTLLSDLEAVGRCLNAVIAARRSGFGIHSETPTEDEVEGEGR